MNNVICLQRTEEICSHANVIAWIAVVAVVVVIFFSISMVSGLQMSNERKVVPLLERILLLLPSFSVPHVQPRKLMFALVGQFESARYSNRKNAMTVDDPSVIFNFECYEIEDDSDLIGDSRSGQFITTFFYYRQQWSVCENRYNVLMAENILHRLIEE